MLEQVERERAFANRALSAALDRARALSPEERALGTELVYGVLRRQARLDRALEAVSDRGLAGLDPRVRIVLRVAAYQILFLDRIPAYAAVNEAVEACKRLRGGPRIAGLANALLRRLADRGEPPLPDPARDPLGYLVEADGLPEWLARLAIDELGGAEAIAFGDTIGAPAPLALRANRLRIDRAGLLARLAEERPGAELAPSDDRARRAARAAHRLAVPDARLHRGAVRRRGRRRADRRRAVRRRARRAHPRRVRRARRQERAPGGAGGQRGARSTPPTSRPPSCARRASSAGAWACGGSPRSPRI